MNILDTFNAMESVRPIDPNLSWETEPTPTPNYVPNSWVDEFKDFRDRPVFRDPDLTVNPNLGNMWFAPTSMASMLGDETRLPALDNKVDPNRIFTAEISALRTLASEQLKITRMFEKKLMEGLSDRGKFGLDENDIAAMQALTSSRSAISQINKGQVDIKKNIADLKIKQNNASNSQANNAGGNDLTGSPLSSIDVGRSIIDNIFSMPDLAPAAVSMPANEYIQGTPESASALLDELVGSVGAEVTYENMNPKTYVRLGEGDSTEYETYTGNGELIPDYPNPSGKIVTIDREAGIATDEYLKTYPIMTAQ